MSHTRQRGESGLDRASSVPGEGQAATTGIALVEAVSDSAAALAMDSVPELCSTEIVKIKYRFRWSCRALRSSPPFPGGEEGENDRRCISLGAASFLCAQADPQSSRQSGICQL